MAQTFNYAYNRPLQQWPGLIRADATVDQSKATVINLWRTPALQSDKTEISAIQSSPPSSTAVVTSSSSSSSSSLFSLFRSSRSKHPSTLPGGDSLQDLQALIHLFRENSLLERASPTLDKIVKASSFAEVGSIAHKAVQEDSLFRSDARKDLLGVLAKLHDKSSSEQEVIATVRSMLNPAPEPR